jgi:hypothetical protein
MKLIEFKFEARQTGARKSTEGSSIRPRPVFNLEVRQVVRAGIADPSLGSTLKCDNTVFEN